MCGIAGFVALPNRGNSGCAPAVLAALEHRGPDDQGWLYSAGEMVERGRKWVIPENEPEVLLLHRRLSIIDTSDSGWQPMSTADERYHLIFNGEIYNYVEIRRKLENLGHRFNSCSDTEVLLYALAEWGIAVLPRLVGMFAFALLDTQRRVLLLARDLFGIKPLFYWKDTGRIFFASEIKALTAFGLSSPRANPERLLLYLRDGLTDFGSETMLSNVQQLPPAHFTEISLDSCVATKPERYWSAANEESQEFSFDQAAEKVRYLFLRNIEMHLRSDVPVGVALSGGIDSSAIVMSIRHLDRDAEIHAFSYISDDAASSEEKWIDIVGSQARAHVHKVRATAGDLSRDLDAMVQLHDEPFGSTSIYAQFRVFQAAQEAGIKVMLDGQGADEILGGYDFYKGARLASLLQQGRWLEAAHFLNCVSQKGNIGSYRGIAHCARFLLPSTMQSVARTAAGKGIYPPWLNRSWFDDRGVDAEFADYTGTQNVLRESLTQSVSRNLPGLLRYEDRNSMAWSVESRVPFLTAELVSFLGTLPECYLIDSQGTSKSIIRKAMRGLVPDAILDRRDKIGFVTPERRWLTELDDWVRFALDGDTAASLPFLNLHAIRKEFDAVRQQRRPFGFHIWRWVNLIRWTERLHVTYE